MSENLAVYAVSDITSRAREFKEPPHLYRSDFERDRDRIVHSEAFRRLEGKTQVFTPGLNDNYRNRLTHSLEVAHIGRTITKRLCLNEILTEAICLAHDLGHPPFGHMGEKIINSLMEDFGGFEHNRQTLHIVDFLEHPYPDFAGLNLMYETRLGLAKHTSTYDKPQPGSFSELNCSLEGQVADVADRIAYNCHDLEDGMRARVIDFEQLQTVEIFREAQGRIKAKDIWDYTIRRIRTAKAIIDSLVSDCIKTSNTTISNANLKSPDEVYQRDDNLVVLSEQGDRKLAELEKFLMTNLYQHDSVKLSEQEAGEWLGGLFKKLCKEPNLMPKYFQNLIETQGLERTVCDYISGMTDRFCLRMVEKI